MKTLLAALLMTLAWDAPPFDCAGAPSGALSYRVYVFDNRCAFDAGGRPVFDIDGSGSVHPRCAARANHVTTSTVDPIAEPRPNEAVGWPGFLEGDLPVVGSIDPAGNEHRSDQPECP